MTRSTGASFLLVLLLFGAVVLPHQLSKAETSEKTQKSDNSSSAATEGLENHKQPIGNDEALPTETDIQGKRLRRSTIIAELENAYQAGSDDSARATIEKKLFLERRIDLLYEQQLQALISFKDLSKELQSNINRETEVNPQVPSNQPPQNAKDVDKPGFLNLEALLDELDREKLKLLRLYTEKDVERTTSSEASNNQREAEARLRQARERSDAAMIEDASLEADVAQERKNLGLLSVRNIEVKIEIQTGTINSLIARINAQRDKVRFSKSELETVLSSIDEERKKIEASKLTFIDKAERAERQWLAHNKRRDLSSPQMEVELSDQRKSKLDAQEVVAILQKEEDLLTRMREIWIFRSNLSRQSFTQQDVRQWKDKLRSFQEETARERRLAQVRLSEYSEQMRALGRQDTTSSQDAQKTVAGGKQDSGEYVERYQKRLDDAETLATRFSGELASSLESQPLAETLLSIWLGVVSIWNYEITTFDDKPITIAKIVASIVLLIIGYIASEKVSRLTALKVFPKLNFERGVSAALQSLLFYLLFVLFGLLALKLVNVPLTIFTLLGGAIAIGVGFGSQNIVKNFISGIIVLIEQPIRVGDLIEVQSLSGAVQRIGLRSTIVRTGDNIDIVVPNSTFLETSVVNWSLYDSRVRLHVLVGVAHESPTDTVRALLLKAMLDHPAVLPVPAPTVWMKDFGSTFTQYEMLFWTDLPSMSEKLKVCSDIRFNVDKLLREQGIKFAAKA